jgi:CRP/FNR family transcriptional regulator
LSEKSESRSSRVPRTPRTCPECGVRHRALCAAVEFVRLGELEQIVSHRFFHPNQTIFEEGDPADYAYNVAEGHVRVPGDFLGLFRHDAYAYGAEAIDDVELCCIGHGDLERLMIKMPEVRDRLLEMSRDELSAAQEQMLLLGRKSAREKLLSFLLLKVQHDIEPAEAQPVTLDLPMSRSDIADFLGLTIETVSRTFSELRKQDLIELPTAQHVGIPDLAALEAAADAE